MKRAVSRGVVATNPVEQIEIKVPGHKEESRRALTEEEQGWIWNTPHRSSRVSGIRIPDGSPKNPQSCKALRVFALLIIAKALNKHECDFRVIIKQS